MKKTGHLPYFLLLLLLLLLQPIRSGADESIGGGDDGVHRATQLSPGQQQLKGPNATADLSNGESARGHSGGGLDPLKRRVSHSKGGGSGGKGGGGGRSVGGGGRSVGGGGSQTVREPRSERRNDAPPSVLLLGCSLSRIVFHALLASVLVF